MFKSHCKSGKIFSKSCHILQISPKLPKTNCKIHFDVFILGEFREEAKAVLVRLATRRPHEFQGRIAKWAKRASTFNLGHEQDGLL